MWAFDGSLQLYLCNKTTYLWILYSKDDLVCYEKGPVLFHGFLSTVIPQSFHFHHLNKCTRPPTDIHYWICMSLTKFTLLKPDTLCQWNPSAVYLGPVRKGFEVYQHAVTLSTNKTQSLNRVALSANTVWEINVRHIYVLSHLCVLSATLKTAPSCLKGQHTLSHIHSSRIKHFHHGMWDWGKKPRN